MEIVVIGLGISSLSLLYKLDSSIDVKCIEEDVSVGYPEHCTGIVSRKLIQILPISKKYVIGRYRRIVIINEKFRPLVELDFKEDIYMIDRAKLDRELFEKIKDKYKINLNEKVLDINIQNQYINLITNSRVLKFDKNNTLIIVSEGARRSLYRRLTGKVERRYVYGIQCDCRIDREISDPDTILVLYSRKYAPGYFAWMVPMGDRYYRIGLGSYTHVKYRFLKLLKIFNVYKMLKIFGGKILLDPGNQVYTHDNNIIFLGDCGGLIKPLTGGGNTLSAFVSTLLSKIITQYDKPKQIVHMYSNLCNIIKRTFIKGFEIQKIVYSKILQNLAPNIQSSAISLICDDYDLQIRYILKPILKRISNRASPIY